MYVCCVSLCVCMCVNKCPKVCPTYGKPLNSLSRDSRVGMPLEIPVYSFLFLNLSVFSFLLTAERLLAVINQPVSYRGNRRKQDEEDVQKENCLMIWFLKDFQSSQSHVDVLKRMTNMEPKWIAIISLFRSYDWEKCEVSSYCLMLFQPEILFN